MLKDQLKKRNPFDSPEQEAYLNLCRTFGLLSNAFDQLFRKAGISQAGYNVLRILRGAGGDGLPCLEVRDRLVTAVPDVTRLVDRLEEDGLVRRARPETDRLVVLVSLTPAGHELLARFDESTLALHRKHLGHLSREELAELSRLTEKARAPFEAR